MRGMKICFCEKFSMHLQNSKYYKLKGEAGPYREEREHPFLLANCFSNFKLATEEPHAHTLYFKDGRLSSIPSWE